MKVNDSEIIKFLLEQSDGTADNDDRMMMMKMARWCHWSNEKDSYEIVRKGFDRSDSLLRSAAQPEVLFEVRLFQGNSEIRQGLFWSMTGVAVVVGLMAAAGNLAVLVMASKTSRNSGNPAASLRRHLNQTIRSLALADLLTAALGFPLITLYYYWDLDGEFASKSDWQLELVWVVPNALTTSTCLHVTFLAAMRLVALRKPTDYRRLQRRYRTTSIVAIWTCSTLASLTPLAVLLVVRTATADSSLRLPATAGISSPYTWSRAVLLHGFHTVPLFLILAMYVCIFWTSATASATGCNAASGTSSGSLRAKRRSVACTTGSIAACLLICYVPYLVQWHMDIFLGRSLCDMTKPWLIFTWMSRSMMLLNSLANPLIYAVTIPYFKAMLSAALTSFANICKLPEDNGDDNEDNSTQP